MVVLPCFSLLLDLLELYFHLCLVLGAECGVGVVAEGSLLPVEVFQQDHGLVQGLGAEVACPHLLLLPGSLPIEVAV